MVAATLFEACRQEDSLAPGKGHICLRLSADDATLTRAQQDVTNPASWYAIITDATSTLYDDQIGDVLEARDFDAGTYNISVRSYDDADAALAANDGWGAAYHEGSANNVEVSAGGTAYVHISCGRALNAKFRLDYSEFSGIIKALTISSPKNLTFSYTDGTLANEAYFTPNSTLTYTITYTFGDVTKTTDVQTLTLGGAATVSTLVIKSDINGALNINLTCDDEFEGDAQSDIIIDGSSGT